MLNLNQRGVAVYYLVIGVLIVLGITGVLVNFFSSSKDNEPSPLPIVDSSPTPAPSATPLSSMMPKSSIKPMATVSPSPMGSPSPTGKPAAKEGVYNLSPKPEQNFTMKASPQSGHQMYAVLQDSNNEVIKNQSKIKFEWSIDNGDLVDMQTGGWGGPGNCSYGITESDPCPKMFGVVTTKGVTGKATVTVKAFDENNKQIGETSFNITVE